jgi:4-hydroxybenzoyl-CoA thioesterase
VSRHRVKVEFGHCDPAQIVYYPNYVAWIDQSTHRLFEAAGFSIKDLQQRWRLQVPIVDFSVKFLSPGRWGDEIEIESRAGRWGRTSFDVKHRIVRCSDHSAIAEAKETRVCVGVDLANAGKLTAHPLPEEVVAALK